MRYAISQERRGRERGSVTVEFAVSILPLFAFVFILLDISWLVFGWACAQEGVREGVRYAITASGQDEAALDKAIQSIASQSSFGFVQGSNVVIHYYSASGYTSAGPPPTLDGSPGSTAAGNLVVVTVPSIAFKSLMPLYRSSSAINLTASASDVLQ